MCLMCLDHHRDQNLSERLLRLAKWSRLKGMKGDEHCFNSDKNLKQTVRLCGCRRIRNKLHILIHGILLESVFQICSFHQIDRLLMYNLSSKTTKWNNNFMVFKWNNSLSYFHSQILELDNHQKIIINCFRTMRTPTWITKWII